MVATNNNRLSTTRMAIGLALISGSLLALEILYVRIVSILLFPVATYLVISLALLGLGASGGLLSLIGDSRINRDLLAFGSVGLAYAILLSLVSVWYVSNVAWLRFLLPVFLSLPMFLGGIALSGVFSMPGSKIPILYFSDLIGAGTSALLVLIGLSFLSAIQVALIVAILALCAAGVFLGNTRRKFVLFSILFMLTLLGLSTRMMNGIVPISPKELRLVQELDRNVEWEYQGWSALARVDVLSIPGDKLDINGGLPYKLVTHDGGAPSLLIQLNSPVEEQLLIENTIFGVPYWITENPKVLIIGLGGGPDVLAALAGGASEVHGAEVSSEMISIVESQFAHFVGDPYSDPRVHIDLTDGRHLLASSDDQYDLIQLTGVDTTVASLGGNPNLAENYLYTREAFIDYLEHLGDDGLLSISFPNVDGLGLRLLALTNEALRAHGIDSIREHVVAGEMTGYIHILVSKSPFDKEEIAVLKEHYEMRPTSVYFPLYHRLFGQPSKQFISESRLVLVPGDRPIGPYADFIEALEKDEGDAFLESQPYNLEPPTDEWPFFFVLDKIGYRTPNYDTLLVTLGLLLCFSFLLMIVPPILLQRRGLHIRRAWSLIIYFACLGLAFIFVEVVFIQKLSLIVGHPSYSLAVTLSTLLISSGIGSYASNHLSLPVAKKAIFATLLISILVILMNLIIAGLGELILQQPLPLRILISSILIMIPGFLMGIPFPSGLKLVQQIEPSFVPWGWGINATFTVVGTILSLILAMTFGFTEVLVAASALYIFALLAIYLFRPIKSSANQ
jgi:hypothetical protein